MQTNQINTEVKVIINRPALRLVSTKNLEREEWLNIRKKGIGSSDAAAAVGLNPYKSQLELWMEKTGRDAELPQLDQLTIPALHSGERSWSRLWPRITPIKPVTVSVASMRYYSMLIQSFHGCSLISTVK